MTRLLNFNNFRYFKQSKIKIYRSFIKESLNIHAQKFTTDDHNLEINTKTFQKYEKTKKHRETVRTYKIESGKTSETRPGSTAERSATVRLEAWPTTTCGSKAES